MGSGFHDFADELNSPADEEAYEELAWTADNIDGFSRLPVASFTSNPSPFS
jgi:hypothetical protein